MELFWIITFGTFKEIRPDLNFSPSKCLRMMCWRSSASLIFGLFSRSESRMWRMLKKNSWCSNKDFVWETYARFSLQELVGLLHNSQPPMIAEYEIWISHNPCEDEIHNLPNMGMMAKSHSTKPCFFRCFSPYFDGFLERLSQNVVSNSFTFTSPQTFVFKQSE